MSGVVPGGAPSRDVSPQTQGQTRGLPDETTFAPGERLTAARLNAAFERVLRSGASVDDVEALRLALEAKLAQQRADLMAQILPAKQGIEDILALLRSGQIGGVGGVGTPSTGLPSTGGGETTIPPEVIQALTDALLDGDGAVLLDGDDTPLLFPL